MNFDNEIDDNIIHVGKEYHKDWMLDSDVCFHVCKYKETFIDHREKNNKTESTNVCDIDVERISSLRLKMYDRIVVRPTRVRHIVETKEFYFNGVIGS